MIETMLALISSFLFVSLLNDAMKHLTTSQQVRLFLLCTTVLAGMWLHRFGDLP